MRRLALVLTVLVGLLAVPQSARAQGYFVPNIGYDFGGSAGDCPSLLNDCNNKKVSYGVTFGGLVGGIFGFEEDIAFAPDFFGSGGSFGTNSVATAMTNLVIAIPAGPVRPYVTGGVGLVRTRLDLLTSPSLANLTNNGFGYDFGGGVMFLFPHHLGVRGDFRYIRSASDIVGISVNSTNVNFARLSIGLVLH
jgi:opacity protein-like surface antigen